METSIKFMFMVNAEQFRVFGIHVAILYNKNDSGGQVHCAKMQHGPAYKFISCIYSEAKQ
jgi:hypothetical protein